MAVLHRFRTKRGLISKRITPLGAIRAQCLECMGWDPGEVTVCQSSTCSLFPFRFGSDPGRKKGK
jgi:hypothetical protein